MYLRDLLNDSAFSMRPKKLRNKDHEAQALRKLCRAFAKDTESVLQELVNTAVEFCGADSAGISLEEPESNTFRWIVVSGSFAPYLNGRTPRNYSPCGTCLDTGRPQLYRVSEPYYEYLGVKADPITDGLLIPWSNDYLHGTLWAVSHTYTEAFDSDDYLQLTNLADFASILLSYQHQQKLVHENEKKIASAEMANKLAHRINNPLQSLTNTIFLAQQDPENSGHYLLQAEHDLKILSEQVAVLLGCRKRKSP